MNFIYLTEQFHDGLTDGEVDQVIAVGKDFDMVPSRDGNDRTMFVGWIQGRESLHEVGVEWLSKTEAIVFHAMKATKEHQDRFNEG
jgi:hypothetical protein